MAAGPSNRSLVWNWLRNATDATQTTTDVWNDMSTGHVTSEPEWRLNATLSYDNLTTAANEGSREATSAQKNETLLSVLLNSTITSSWSPPSGFSTEEINDLSLVKGVPNGPPVEIGDEGQSHPKGQDHITLPAGNVLHIEGVGLIQTPNLSGHGILPQPDFQHPEDVLWKTLSPQDTLTNISQSATAQVLNEAGFEATGFWISEYDRTWTNVTDISGGQNFTLPLTPTGYLSGYSTEHVIITSVLVTLLMIIIVVGNGLVVLAIAIDRNLKAVQNWFIASLAVSDLLVGLLIMPFSLANELMGYWYFGEILCELWLATDVLLCTASIMNLCLISLDRFWSITRAISYVKQRTKKRAILMIALVWILSMIICFPPLVGWKRPQPIKYGKPLCVLSEDIGYVVYSTLGSFYIPLVVMVIVYFKIYLAARSRARRGLKKAQKQQQPVLDNGKSTSTTTNTTTSFSTPTRDKACKANNIEKEFSSFDENCEEGSKPESGQVSPTEKDVPKDNVHLSVPNQHLHVHHLDEKKKLLSDDTDSACDSPVKRNQRKLNTKHIHFSEDTDSPSDSPGSRANRAKFNGYNRHSPRNRSSTEENMKPLLEDSQLESDSQRDSDKLMVQNNNTGVTKTDEHEEPEPGGEDGGSSEHDESGEHLNNETYHGNRKAIVLTPASFSRLNIQMRKNKLEKHEKHKRTLDDPERQKRRIARAKERRAFIVLGIIMATFILCWLPFFSTYLISSVTGVSVPGLVFAVFFWAGYCNSALNPVTYTIFNRDFRQAFSKILFGRRSWR